MELTLLIFQNHLFSLLELGSEISKVIFTILGIKQDFVPNVPIKPTLEILVTQILI